MTLHFRTINNPLFSFLTSFPNQKLSKTLITMASRRPTCPSCSKPTPLCLCIRIKNPSLNNSIAVTILQHTLEHKHPLNSAKIASLGLRNVKTVSVSDVNSDARFRIRPIEDSSEMGFDCFDDMNNGSNEKSAIDNDTQFRIRPIGYDSEMGFDCFDDRNNGLKEKSSVSDVDNEARFGVRPIENNSEMGFDCFDDMSNGLNAKSPVFDVDNEARFGVRPIGYDSEMGFDCFRDRNNGSNSNSGIDFLVSKYGVNVTGPNFDSTEVSNALSKGFVVEKWKNKLGNAGTKDEDFKEFELEVPPGSALLFPSDESVGIESINFNVKNLIVLDGTWAKAKRIYSENPWLKVLSHVKMDLDKLSLYNEVRHQPRAGYLSTIESIVYAMKGLGEENDGLDHLLEVFESMVGDQRRCKDERLSKISKK